jgi:hypothetical protein
MLTAMQEGSALLSQELRATFVVRDKNKSTSQLDGGHRKCQQNLRLSFLESLQDNAKIHEA